MDQLLFPPEQLLSALLLQGFYGIRSERQLMEQLDYNLLYRWFVGLSPDDPMWDSTVFTKNRDRLQNGKVFATFMTKLLNHPQVKPLLSDEHFSVDGTLIEAWASKPKKSKWLGERRGVLFVEVLDAVLDRRLLDVGRRRAKAHVAQDRALVGHALPAWPVFAG